MVNRVIKEEILQTKEEEQELIKLVSEIVSKVRSNGDSAIKEYTSLFDQVKLDNVLFTKEEIASSIDLVPNEVKELIDTNISRIRKFAEFQLSMYKEMELEVDGGETILGQRVLPVESVGVYVPGGRFPLLSSALMAIVPAKVAGVERIIAATPPGKNRPDPSVIYGIVKSGANEILKAGGAQAIAAMAYGTESVKKVDKIVGPGNKYVNEAKRQVFGAVGIDLLAGPSEVLIIADETADPIKVGYDLLAQAEHDVAARSCLVTTSAKLASDVEKKMDDLINSLSTKEILKVSWKQKGSIILSESLDDAIEYANSYAPEHLELHLSKESEKVAFRKLRNYGSLFLNEMTPVVFSDKLIGTNHILPTNAAARYTGGLSVGSFLKILTYQKVRGTNSLRYLSERAFKQSTIEGLAGHAKSAALRMSES
ncbi:MAG: histidinol dehydrogenase [Candidatus Parvarchaeota archaeon]